MSEETIVTPPAMPGIAIIGNVVALRAADSTSDDLPQRVRLFTWGENLGRTTGAKIVIGEKSLSCLSVNQKRFARDLVALDYEHQSVPGHPRFKEDPRHNAAHGSIELIEGDGVYLSGLNYTPSGREHALSYADVSAVAHTDADGNLLMVSSVALTQAGDVSGMTFAEAVAALSATPPVTPSLEKPKPMEKQTDKFRDLLVTMLGLKPADGEDKVSDEAIAQAVVAYDDKKATKPAMPSPKPEGDVVALSARIDLMERQNLLQGAALQGKEIPLSATEIDSTPIETLKSIIEKTPAGTVPMTRKGATEQPGTDVTALSADDEKVMKQLGLTEEEYRAGQ